MQNSWIIWTFLGYLAGSIPFGLLIGLGRGVDIRQAGSGNVGATNTGRLLGRKWGIICLLLDMLKGLTPVLAAGYAMGYLDKADLGAAEAFQWLAVAAAAVVGHVFPIWLKFKGGKGVATSLGVLLGFWPTLTLPGIGAILTWIVFALVFRFVSLASIAAALGIPVYLFVLSEFTPMQNAAATVWPFYVLTLVLAGIVIIRHRSNLARIFNGTEPKIGRKS